MTLKQVTCFLHWKDKKDSNFVKFIVANWSEKEIQNLHDHFGTYPFVVWVMVEALMWWHVVDVVLFVDVVEGDFQTCHGLDRERGSKGWERRGRRNRKWRPGTERSKEKASRFLNSCISPFCHGYDCEACPENAWSSWSSSQEQTGEGVVVGFIVVGESSSSSWEYESWWSEEKWKFLNE